MLAEPLSKHDTQRDDSPREDHIVVLRDVSWSDYQRMLEIRGEVSVPRFSYLEGQLEIMTPSKHHESIKSRIGRLVEVWCLEQGVEFSPCGSWTLESKVDESGLEPDECYVFGERPDAERPDLAIEVIWTSGGLSKLAIYARLQIPEVWVWRRDQISVHRLSGEQYVAVASSQSLPGIDLAVLAGFLDRPTASQAMREYRSALVDAKR